MIYKFLAVVYIVLFAPAQYVSEELEGIKVALIENGLLVLFLITGTLHHAVLNIIAFYCLLEFFLVLIYCCD